MPRLSTLFSTLKTQNRPALVTFTMAGDPDLARSEALLLSLPGAGADIVELGMPFSDPAADGPSIQAAGVRALKAGTKTKDVLGIAARFRAAHPITPLILMGYYNPILHYGPEAFARDAAAAGADGVIVVDLPPEEEAELATPLAAHRLAFIRLIAPTTGDARLARILRNASGFVYTIGVKGITGTTSAASEDIAARVAHLREFTSLPIVAGFGIRTPEQAAALKASTDGIVIGSAIVERAHNASAALAFMRELAAAIR